MQKDKMGKKELIKKLIPIIIIVAIALALTLIFLPEIKKLLSEEGREEFKDFIDSLGAFGWLIGLLIVLLQIFVAFIPGEPVELFMGYAFGSWLGTAICLLGSLIATVVIYYLVKMLGQPYVRKITGKEAILKYKFLKDEKKIELAVVILFIIPGTPKDLLLYVFPFTKIKKGSYFVLSTFARIPSVVTSTFLGGSIAKGNYLAAIILFAATALVSVIGIILGNRIINKRSESLSHLPENKNEE